MESMGDGVERMELSVNGSSESAVAEQGVSKKRRRDINDSMEEAVVPRKKRKVNVSPDSSLEILTENHNAETPQGTPGRDKGPTLSSSPPQSPAQSPLLF